jgi:hypothetical protein
MNTADTATAPAAPAAPKAVREKQNGITRPIGEKTAKIWAICDSISAAKGSPALRAEVLEAASAAGCNLKMAASHYSCWRTFHGLIGDKAPGRVAAAAKPPKAPKAPAVAAAPAAPEAPAAPVEEQTG